MQEQTRTTSGYSLAAFLLVGIFVLVCVFVAALLWCMEPRPTCNSIHSYSEAISLFPTHPYLDGDHDGVPCEVLKAQERK